MEQLRAYILRVTIAALICSLIRAIPLSKTVTASMVKLLCGIILMLSVISPLLQLRFEAIADSFQQVWADGQMYLQQGEELSRQQRAQIILSRTEAYILDKAKARGLEITVEVMLADDELLRPCGVRIEGAVPPYERTVLSSMIEQDLDISKEDQIWTG